MDKIGFRRKNSDVAHLLWWMSRGQQMEDGSACGRAPWKDDDLWTLDEGFDPDGTIRLCVHCQQMAVNNVVSLLEVLWDWGVDVGYWWRPHGPI